MIQPTTMSLVPRSSLFLGIGVASVICFPIAKNVVHPTYHNEKNRPDRTVIVTGATGNLGSSMCYHFAKRNIRVVMACRDLDKCKALRREIVLETGNKGIVCRYLDLENIDSINQFANEMIEKEPHIDILVNNAAIKETNGKELTKDGKIEKHFFVNYLAPYLLTMRLMDKLAESASITKDSRIINVIGKPKKNWKVDLDDINFDRRKFNNSAAYNQSKLALAYFTILLEKFNRKQKNCVYVFGVDPVFKRIAESFDRSTETWHRLKKKPIMYFYSHPERIIQPIINCALAPDLIRGGSGKLYNYALQSVGFNGAWGIAGKNEMEAKLVWNKAVDLLLKEPVVEPRAQEKQEEKSKASVEDSA